MNTTPTTLTLKPGHVAVFGTDGQYLGSVTSGYIEKAVRRGEVSVDPSDSRKASLRPDAEARLLPAHEHTAIERRRQYLRSAKARRAA